MELVVLWHPGRFCTTVLQMDSSAIFQQGYFDRRLLTFVPIIVDNVITL
jgi:hypothetical protein